MEREILERFKGRLIWLLKEEHDHQFISLIGHLKEVSDTTITLESRQNLRVIPISSIQEVKVRKC